MPTGIITPVWVNELIPREYFCMLYAHWVDLFGMRAVLCSYLRLISRCVIFFNVHCAYSCKFTAPTDKNSGNESKNKFKTQYFSFFQCFFIIS